MVTPPQRIKLTKEQLLSKYYDDGWEERLPLFDLEVRERQYPRPSSQSATIRKRSEFYRDKDSHEIVLARHIFERANKTTSTVITFMLDGANQYELDDPKG